MKDVSGLNGWALIEIFGHTRLAGKISEESLGGSSLLRVDVPDENGGTKMTKFLGVASIFSITMTTEEIARKAAKSIDAAPISVYELTRIELESIRERAEAIHKRETEIPALGAPSDRTYELGDEEPDDISFEREAIN